MLRPVKSRRGRRGEFGSGGVSHVKARQGRHVEVRLRGFGRVLVCCGKARPVSVGQACSGTFWYAGAGCAGVRQFVAGMVSSVASW